MVDVLPLYLRCHSPRKRGNPVTPRLLGLINNCLWNTGSPAFAGDDSGGYIRNNACRSIFPVPVFGNSSMKIISRGYL